LGFAFLFITFPTPWLLAGAWLTDSLAAGPIDTPHLWAAFASGASTVTGFAARMLLHFRAARHQRTFWRDLPFVPLRDTLLALQWLVGWFGSHVIWRGTRMPVRTSARVERGTALGVMDVMETSDGG
jgi:ceramide glucosyltransferase